jgi:autotransporter-associated beta strand protein
VRVETQPDGSGTLVAAQSVAPGGAGTVTAYAISRDTYGNFLGNVSATWSLQNKTGGVVDGDLAPASGLSSTFTGNLSGTANIRASSGVLTSVDSGLLTVSRAITWVGGGANPWNFTTANWTPDFGSTFVKFLDSDDVTFDASGSSTSAINVTTNVAPHSVTFSGGGPYTLDGNGGITGTASLTNGSSATFSATALTLLNSNSYSGSTIVAFGGTLQLGNGVKNGSFGTGPVRIETGGTSPIFNRTDSVGSPYVVSNTISAPTSDFTMEFKSGAVKLAGNGVNAHATAVVRSGATLILGKDVGGGSALGNATALGATLLNIEAGGTVKLGSAVADHITGAGKVIQIEGTFDANGYSEGFGIIQGSGIIDNTSTSNALLTVNQGSSAVGGIGNAGELYTFYGLIRNTGTGLLSITKDNTNTLVLFGANTYGGDTRIVNGGILELGHVNSMQNSTLDYRTGDIGRISFGALSSASLGGFKGNKNLTSTNETGGPVNLTLNVSLTNNYTGALDGATGLLKNGSGTQALGGTNTYAGPTTVSQGTLLVNGCLSGLCTVTVSGNGTLGGSGFINGPVSVSGSLRPGNNAIGKLSVNNTATLSGSTVMEISLTTTTNADQLAATTIALGGNLTVTNVGALTLKSGNTFALFSGAVSGSIAVNSLPPLWPGLSWNTSALNSAGTISVAGTAIPPVVSSVSAAGGNLTLSGAGGLPGAVYYVVSTNNIAVPLANWPRISTNVFAADGKFTNSIPVSPITPQAFYGIQVP